MSFEVVVVGSFNTDFVLRVARFPAPGETILCGQFAKVPGGKGANQAVAAARLGANVAFVARLGNDSAGHEALAAFRSEGIHTDYVALDDHAPSGLALITVDAEGENTIVVVPGANALLTPADIHRAEAVFQRAQMVLVQLEIPSDTVSAAAQCARKHGARVILNPAPASTLPSALLRQIDYLTPNEAELAALLGVEMVSDPNRAALDLAVKTGIRQVIVTLGARGALIAGEPGQVVPAYPVIARDTTAAGDAFNAGLAVALTRGMGLVDAVRYANAVGALTATRPGAQPSLPTASAIESFLRTQ